MTERVDACEAQMSPEGERVGGGGKRAIASVVFWHWLRGILMQLKAFFFFLRGLQDRGDKGLLSLWQ